MTLVPRIEKHSVIVRNGVMYFVHEECVDSFFAKVDQRDSLAFRRSA